MSKKIRILSAILAALMLAGPLASCANEAEPTDTNAPRETNSAVTAAEGETELTDSLPDDLNYGGDEITILSRYREGWTSGEIAVPELISEPVNDAVYERNKSVEERLGVKLISLEEHTDDYHLIASKVATAVKAGTHEYDIAAAASGSAAVESLNGTFANLRNAAYLDFEKPWWTQGFNEATEYQGAQYLITGAMLLSMYRFAFVTVFNHKLFTDARQPFLYEYVENGTWTLDKQISLVPLFHQDNGNGVQDEEGDVYGFISNDLISVDPYWSACKVDYVRKNEIGEYEQIFDVNHLHDVAEKTLRLYYNTDGGTYNVKHIGGDYEQEIIRRLFAEGFGAMATLRIMELEHGVIRSMEEKFGVVPMPKYDEKQDSHYTLLHNQFTALCIPTTVTGDRLNEVSAVLEALGSASYHTVKPAYYETTLRTKIAQDPQSAEMMDIIVNNVRIDSGLLYCAFLDSFHDQFRQLMQGGVNDTSSRFKKVTKKTLVLLGRLNKKLTALATEAAD